MRLLTACSAVFSIAIVVYAQTGPQAAKIPACVVSQTPLAMRSANSLLMTV
jgi:hypothetical protein